MDEASLGQGLWRAVVEQLAQEMPEQQFNTWIKPLTAVVADDLSKVTLYVANRFKLDWIRAQYAGRLAAMPLRFSRRHELRNSSLAQPALFIGSQDFVLFG